MEKMRIQAVHVAHIGPFEELNLQFPEKVKNDLAEIHIFSGENGTGKSTLLEIISCFDNRSNSLTPKVHFGSQAAIDIEFAYNEHGDKRDTYRSRFGGGRWLIQLPSFLDFYFSKMNSHQEAVFDLAFFAYSGYRRLNNSNLGAIQELSNSPLINSMDFNASIDPSLLIQWIANTKTKEALSQTKGDLEKARQYHLALKRIEDVISEITDVPISFEMDDNPLAVTIKADGLKLQFNTLPDGLKSIISWVADLLMRMDRLKWQNNIDIFDRSFILFLDEIDVHLHPKWQRKVLPVIQKLFKNAQIFVSTHSPFVIGSVDNAWVYKFEKNGKYSQLAMPPFLSEDANSYRMILEEVFGINKQFGLNIERQLDRFYQLKSNILGGNDNDISEFASLSKELASQSNELESIIGMELKQIRKIKGERFESLL